MVDSKVDPEFGKLVKKHLDKTGIPVAQFAKKVGVDPSFVWHFINGKRYPPEDLTLWADTLGLKGAEREVFVIEGGLTRCPESIQVLVRKLWKKPTV